MKFTALTITNFLTIGNASLSLDGKGLVLVQGVNEDDGSANSNGAGKSSIADALSWVLYGITARGVTGDAVVNKTAGKGTMVSVNIEDGAAHYNVTRFRKHSGGKNSLKVSVLGPSGGMTDLSRGTDRETQDLVETIIGCSYDVFRAAVYCGQEQMPDLPGMTDKQLKLLIEEAAGISRIERAYEVARAKLRDSELVVVKARSADEKATQGVTNANAALGQLTVDSMAWDGQHAVRVNNLKSELATEKTNFLALAGPLKDFDKMGLETKKAGLQAGLASYQETQKQIVTARSKASAAASAVAAKEMLTRRLADSVKRVKEDIAHVVDGVGKPCRECGKPHTKEDCAKVLDVKTQELEKLSPQIKAAKAEWDAAKATYEGHALDLAGLEAVPPPSEAINAINAINTQLNAFEAKLANLRSVKANCDRVAQMIKNAEAETNPIKPAIDRTQKQLADFTAAKEAAGEALAAALAHHVLSEIAVKVFGPAGVRAHILDTVTPFLNERTAEYLTTLSDGNLEAVWSTLSKTKAGELREKFCIDVQNKTGAESFTGLSGGEKRKVRLAAMLALQDLVASRAVKPIDLFVADEVDDALDPSGLERLMTVLEKRARERGTVLLVSHADLADWVDQVTTVTKSGGYAKLEGALCL
jgi:DNA repair exonuclease SbcCD ATPase subunit